MLGIPTVTIDKSTLTSAANDVTFTVDTSMLSFTPKHLIMRTSAAHDSKDSSMYVRLNGDTGSNYNNIRVSGTGTAEASAVSDGDSAGLLINIDDATNEFGAGEWLIADAFNTTTYKTVMGLGGWDYDNSVWMVLNRWDNTAAITSVTFRAHELNGFGSGSSFELCVVDESYNFNTQVMADDASGGFSVGSITQAPGHLVCIGNLRSDNDADTDTLKMHYTGSGGSDTTSSNYERKMVGGSSTTLGASNDNDDIFGIVSGDTASQDSEDSFGSFIHCIPNYSDGGNDRSSISLSGEYADNAKRDIQLEARHWRNNDSITAFSLIPGAGSNFLTNSILSTYLIPNDDNLIERIELGSDTDVIDFASIPDTYDHLEITAYMRVSRSSTSHSGAIFINAAGGTSQTGHGVQIFQAGGSWLGASAYTDDAYAFSTCADNDTANNFSTLVFTVYNYKTTDRDKLIIAVSGQIDEGSSEDNILLVAKRWDNTAAINRIVLDHRGAYNYLTGTTVELRGISSTIPDPPVTFIPETRIF